MRFTIASGLTAILIAPVFAMAADSACPTNDLAEANRQLNAVYQSVLNQRASSVVFIKKLRIAQRAWVSFREAEVDSTYACEEPNPASCWGTVVPLLHASYKAKLTCERTERLRGILTEADRSSL